MTATKDLFDAIQRGDLAAVKARVAAEPRLASARNEAGVSAPLFALYCGKADIARELAELRTDLDIFEATAFGKTPRVAELVTREPELVNSRSPDGFSPLGFAAFFGSVDVLELLIARGADVNAASQNAMRVAPLHSAAAQRDPDASLRSAQKLIAAGADVNARQQGGWTPLHAAAGRGHLPLVKLLLAHGASAQAKNDDGKTALDVARERQQAEAAKMLGG